MKDRADYARKGIARGQALAALVVRRGHPHLRREPVDHAAQGQRDLRPHRLRRCRASTTSSTSCASPASATPTSRATRSAARTSTPSSLANAYAQMLGDVFTHEMKPMEVEILVAEVGRSRAATGCSTSSTTAPSWTRTASPCWAAARPTRSPSASSATYQADQILDGALRAAVAALAGPERQLTAAGARGRRARPRRRPPGVPPPDGRRGRGDARRRARRDRTADDSGVRAGRDHGEARRPRRRRGRRGRLRPFVRGNGRQGDRFRGQKLSRGRRQRRGRERGQDLRPGDHPAGRVRAVWVPKDRHAPLPQLGDAAAVARVPAERPG